MLAAAQQLQQDGEASPRDKQSVQETRRLAGGEAVPALACEEGEGRSGNSTTTRNGKG